MRIACIVISYYFNFLAEVVLPQLACGMPAGAKLWVLHVAKTQEQLDDFRPSHPHCGQLVAAKGEVTHGLLLDKLIAERRWPEVTGQAECLVLVDHDALFCERPGFWDGLGRRLVSGVAAGCMLSALRYKPSRPRVFWWTTPAFAVHPSFTPPVSWSGIQLSYGYYDTGQFMTDHMLNAGCGRLLDLFDMPSGVHLHWGSPFHWMNPYCTRKNLHPKRVAAIRQAIEHHAELFRSGFWMPREPDIRRFGQRPMLDAAWKIATQGLVLGYDGALPIGGKHDQR